MSQFNQLSDQIAGVKDGGIPSFDFSSGSSHIRTLSLACSRIKF